MTVGECRAYKKQLDEREAEAARVAATLDKVSAFLRGEHRKDGFSTGGLEMVLSTQQVEAMNELHAARQKWKSLLADLGIAG